MAIKILHVCASSTKPFVVRLFACNTTCTCTIRLINIISFGPSHVTYRIYVVSHPLDMNVQPSNGAMPDP